MTVAEARKMKAADKNKLAVALADAVVERLWVLGLISEEERALLHEKNSLEVLS